MALLLLLLLVRGFRALLLVGSGVLFIGGIGTVAEAFNVDVTSATTYSGSPGSFFGFSVDLHQSGGGLHHRQPIVNW